MAISGLKVVDINPEIAFQSPVLPGEFHSDPADRIMVATARVLRAAMVTNLYFSQLTTLAFEMSKIAHP